MGVGVATPVAADLRLEPQTRVACIRHHSIMPWTSALDHHRLSTRGPIPASYPMPPQPPTHPPTPRALKPLENPPPTGLRRQRLETVNLLGSQTRVQTCYCPSSLCPGRCRLLRASNAAAAEKSQGGPQQVALLGRWHWEGQAQA